MNMASTAPAANRPVPERTSRMRLLCSSSDSAWMRSRVASSIPNSVAITRSAFCSGSPYWLSA